MARRRKLAELPLPMAAGDAVKLIGDIATREAGARVELKDGRVLVTAPSQPVAQDDA